MTKKKWDYESDDKCPKCGVKQWWLLDDNSHILQRGGKTLIILSFCKSCHSYFKREKKLIQLSSSGKLKVTQHELSRWQLFSRDCLANGKTLKEASHLYWKEWQTHKKRPTSLATLTPTGE